ncbi:hypothetical protein K493DRAFT_317122, partial [Basidiobolus meristosporus CBS 931.73]
MRFSSIISGLVALTVVAAKKDSIPSLESHSKCVNDCVQTTGAKLLIGFTTDPKDSGYYPSLSLMCDYNTPNTTTFHTELTHCFYTSKCDTKDGTDFNKKIIIDACNGYENVIH